MLMKTDAIRISSTLEGREEALKAAERFNEYNKFTGKNAMHIRLLTEELVSMVHGIMEDLKGDLWLESEFDNDEIVCRICFSAAKIADPKQEEQLLSVASSGRNENAKGILGKIREAFRVSAQHSADGVYLDEYTSVNNWYSMGAHRGELPDSAMASECYWSLSNYRSSVYSERNTAKEEWDELEKSIIGKLADDVKVWLRSGNTEVIVEKRIKA